MSNLLKLDRVKKLKYAAIGLFLFLGLFLFILCMLPKPALLENFTFSSAVYDRKGRLLRLTLSRDDKYRLFTFLSDIPKEAQQALLLYEDKNFYSHFGIDPLAVGRASLSMLTKGRKQGASTITMQLARLVFDINSSTFGGKIIQMFRAIQIERHYSKKQILEAYFNLAPYGDNIEGFGAASVIYFQTKPEKLSLPEILSLIVVPQNPVKRNPARHPEALMVARDRLSDIWRENYPNDSQNTYLSLPVNVSSKSDIPFLAPHLTTRVLRTRAGNIETTIDVNLQRQFEDVLSAYVRRNKYKGIHNAALLVINYQTMETLAYVGSANFWDDKIFGQVNGIIAPRSPGSAMKPFIYTLAMEQGLIHPMTLLNDLPKAFIAYNPENFDNNYQGAVTATRALVASLNIPAVDLLQRLETGSFYSFLKKLGVKSLKSESYYGLAMALGGYEISLSEMVKAYAGLAKYGFVREIREIKEEPIKSTRQLLSPESSFLTLQMLGKNSPTDGNKKHPVYWKTGTSYSYKDAWTLGVAGKYAIGVWIGNFDGTPNHAFVGRTAAAPLFFEIVRALEKQDDFENYAISADGLNLARVDICTSTGDIANKHCPITIKGWFIPGVSPIKLSNIHREIPIDVETGLRACRHRPPLTKLVVHEFWSSDILAAFERGGISKKLPPPFIEDCFRSTPNLGMPPNIVSPLKDMIYIVRAHRLDEEKLMLKASADSDVEMIYWFLNNALLGQTKPDEPLEVKPQIGSWQIKAIDDKGRIAIHDIVIQLEN